MQAPACAVLAFVGFSFAQNVILGGNIVPSAAACRQPCYVLPIARDLDQAILAANSEGWNRALDLRTQQDIHVLAGSLEDPAEVVRIMAAQRLSFVGPAGEAVLPALLHAMANDTSARVRIHCASAVLRYPDRAADAIPVLISQLRDPEEQVRGAMLTVLTQIGPEGYAALAGTLTGEHPVRSAVLQQFQRLARFPNRFRPIVQHVAVREAILDMVRRARSPTDVATGATLLAAFQIDAERALPALRAALERDTAGAERTALLHAISAYEVATVNVDLAKQVQAPAVVQQASIARVTVSCGTSVPQLTLEECRDRIASADAKSQLVGLGAGAYLRAEAEPLVEDVIERLPEWIDQGLAGRKHVRAALLFFTSLGPKAQPVLTHVERLLESADAGVRQHAFNAYVAIQKDEALPLIRAWIDDDRDSSERAQALTLVHSYMSFEEAMPFLERGLQDKMTRVRNAAVQATARFGAAAEPLVDILIAGIDDTRTGDAYVRTLGSMGSGARAAIPALVRKLEGEIDRVQKCRTRQSSCRRPPIQLVGSAIVLIDPAAAAPSVVRMLNSSYASLQRPAFQLARNMYKMNDEVRDALIPHVQGADARHRVAALATLAKHNALDSKLLEGFLLQAEGAEQVERAIQLVGHTSRNESVRHVLVAAMASNDVKLRRRCALALSTIPRQNAHELTTELLQALDGFARTAPPEERAGYLRALNRVDPPASVGTRTVADAVPSPTPATATIRVLPPASAPREP